MTNLPSGFEPLELDSPFVVHNGPLFVRREGTGLSMGFFVEERHTNIHGTLHGGMLALLGDMALGYAAATASGEFKPVTTISMSMDILRATGKGAWVEARAELLRSEGRLIFARGLILVDGEAVANVSSIVAAPKR